MLGSHSPYNRKSLSLIFVCLFRIAGLTKHLTIIWGCLPALAPRLDVVALHFVIFKMLTADGAYSVLLAVRRHFILFNERPQIEKPASKWIRVAAKQKFVDTLRLLHLVVFVQTLYLRAYRGGVIDTVMIFVVEMTPVNTFHI